ncbi:MAG: hydrogenase expression/formation protein HypE [Candidatus Edwardsbacteria bacterium]|jgi:hydrogenase expression/formation protein HypE|nr:hydrogenase expression/formation protein HypE [Candidatus Edwardsbacteria bacterium]
MAQQGEIVTLAHGSGGRLSHELIERVFRRRFDNEWLRQGDDSAEFRIQHSECRMAFTTDSYTVKPLFFPGGDIGRLAVCGTVNDLAMKGARPLLLSAGFIIEEGFPLADLDQAAGSMAAAAAEAGVSIATGDTKVVDRGACDGLFINTSGIGVIPDGVDISGANARPGDAVIVSGTLGDHSVAVMNARHGFGLSGDLASDVAPLADLVRAMLGAGGVRVLRDPTRGGLATTLNEIAGQSRVSITVEEPRLPVRPQVRGACEMLGLDPLYCANEGKLVAVADPGAAGALLAAMRGRRDGRDAAVIGTVGTGAGVALRTALGAHRPLLMLEGEALPRIC